MELPRAPGLRVSEHKLWGPRMGWLLLGEPVGPGGRSCPGPLLSPAEVEGRGPGWLCPRLPPLMLGEGGGWATPRSHLEPELCRPHARPPASSRISLGSQTHFSSFISQEMMASGCWSTGLRWVPGGPGVSQPVGLQQGHPHSAGRGCAVTAVQCAGKPIMAPKGLVPSRPRGCSLPSPEVWLWASPSCHPVPTGLARPQSTAASGPEPTLAPHCPAGDRSPGGGRKPPQPAGPALGRQPGETPRPSPSVQG